MRDNLNVEVYKAGDSADRLRALNSVENMQFQARDYDTEGINWAIKEELLTKADQRILHETLANNDYLRYHVKNQRWEIRNTLQNSNYFRKWNISASCN